MSNASDEDEATPYSPSGLYKIAQITTLLKPYKEDNQEEDEYEDPELENLELEREALEAEARALDAQSDEHNAGREPIQKNIVFTEQILDLHFSDKTLKHTVHDLRQENTSPKQKEKPRLHAKA
ncbi:hypothetical protein PTMSG1_05944 [Pyrenophora teres f. maculata]|nr:hypothetical protein PTMSG1_05944 [Pyrenophora teres f. maculata]